MFQVLLHIIEHTFYILDLRSAMRQILHADMNNFYASVELRDHPELQGHPLAVCGDPDARQGIVLAKDYRAKAAGVRTGQAIWQARRLCPELILMPPRFDRYLELSAQAKEIYVSYTDQVESFGLDECWLDVTGSAALFGGGRAIADDIRARVKRELGLTASVGVSFNKVFAKLGSDLKKPDATTVISPENYRELAWGLPVSDLLYVGPATTKKLLRCGIRTIGELARVEESFLYRLLGKNGLMLHRFANGRDSSGVSVYYAMPPVKTIGNSTTAPRDLTTERDVTITFLALCESVAARLREQRCVCSTLQIGIRDSSLLWYERQGKLPLPCASAKLLCEKAMELFRSRTPEHPVRSLSVRASSLSPAEEFQQLTLFPEEQRRQKLESLERAMDKVRTKYGYESIRRGIMLTDPALDLDAKGTNIVHPIGFLQTVTPS